MPVRPPAPTPRAIATPHQRDNTKNLNKCPVYSISGTSAEVSATGHRQGRALTAASAGPFPREPLPPLEGHITEPRIPLDEKRPAPQPLRGDEDRSRASKGIEDAGPAHRLRLDGPVRKLHRARARITLLTGRCLLPLSRRSNRYAGNPTWPREVPSGGRWRSPHPPTCDCQEPGALDVLRGTFLPTRLDRVGGQIGPAAPFDIVAAVANLRELSPILQWQEGRRFQIGASIKRPETPVFGDYVQRTVFPRCDFCYLH